MQVPAPHLLPVSDPTMELPKSSRGGTRNESPASIQKKRALVMNKRRLEDRRVQETGTSDQGRIILDNPTTGLAAVPTVAASGHEQYGAI
jgi:hypothetical protein